MIHTTWTCTILLLLPYSHIHPPRMHENLHVPIYDPYSPSWRTLRAPPTLIYHPYLITIPPSCMQPKKSPPPPHCYALTYSPARADLAPSAKEEMTDPSGPYGKPCTRQLFAVAPLLLTGSAPPSFSPFCSPPGSKKEKRAKAPNAAELIAHVKKKGPPKDTEQAARTFWDEVPNPPSLLLLRFLLCCFLADHL